MQAPGPSQIATGGQQRRQVRQGLGMGRFQVKGLAVIILGFTAAPGHVAEQAQPVEGLGGRTVGSEITLAGGASFIAAPGVGEGSDVIQ